MYYQVLVSFGTAISSSMLI